MTFVREGFPSETPERCERLKRLQNLELQVCGMNNALYNETELNALNVHTEPFTLDESGEPLFTPCFFEPFKGEIKDDPYMEGNGNGGSQWYPYMKTDLLSPMAWARFTYSYWYHYMFAQALEFEERTGVEVPVISCRPARRYALHLVESTGPVEWLSWGAGHLRDFPKRPHFICFMVTDIDGEHDKITRGELLCILRMQKKFHKVSFLERHFIYPILLMSYMEPRHARMLQAYYNGSELVIHKTDLYDFTEDRNVKALSLLSRWSAASGVGSTRLH